MQDAFAALIDGRPPHISPSNGAVKPVVGTDFPENAADEDEEDGSTEVEKRLTLFSQMITFSRMLAEILDVVYSQQAEKEIQAAAGGTKSILERAKPIQLKLKAWYTEMPECLRMDNVKVRKLSSTGYLHLAYFATEITLHRRIIRSLSSDTDPYLTQICRSAAKLVDQRNGFLQSSKNGASAVLLVLCVKGQLRTDWYFQHSLMDHGIDERGSRVLPAEASGVLMDFGVSSKSADFLEIASGILDRPIGVLMKVAENPGHIRKVSQTAEIDKKALENGG